MVVIAAALAPLVAMPVLVAASGSLFYHHGGRGHSGDSKHDATPDDQARGNADDDSVEDRCAAIAASLSALGSRDPGAKRVVYQCRSTFGTLTLPDGSKVHHAAPQAALPLRLGC